jgi:DNA topoisomerase-2
MYGTRKEYLIDALEKELILMSNKAKYITENLDGTIDLRKKKKEQVVEMLQQKGYNKVEGDEDYKYLTKMPMDSVTNENVDKLKKERDETMKDLEALTRTTLEQMWMRELDNLEVKYNQYKKIRENLQNAVTVKKTTTAKKVVAKK